MMESNQQTQFASFFNYSISKSITDFAKKCILNLVYIFHPEDTLVTVSDLADNKTRSTVKVLFWVAVAMVFSLAVGQLK